MLTSCFNVCRLLCHTLVMNSLHFLLPPLKTMCDAADVFMSNTSFNPWDGICVGDISALFLRLYTAYGSYSLERERVAESHY